MEYHLDIPLSVDEVKKLKVGDILYVTGTIFTARDEAHHIMLESKKIPFDPSKMGLFHCGPLMKKVNSKWQVVSAGPTTSSRMEIFEDKFKVFLIITPSKHKTPTSNFLNLKNCKAVCIIVFSKS